MPLIWTPDPELPLIVSQEHQTHISATVEVQADEQSQPPRTLIWSMPDGRLDHMQVRTVGNTLTLTIENWAAMGSMPCAMRSLASLAKSLAAKSPIDG